MEGGKEGGREEGGREEAGREGRRQGVREGGCREGRREERRGREETVRLEVCSPIVLYSDWECLTIASFTLSKAIVMLYALAIICTQFAFKIWKHSNIFIQVACIDPLQLLLTICVRFSCCSLIASALAAAPRLLPPLVALVQPNVLEHSLQSLWFKSTKVVRH